MTLISHGRGGGAVRPISAWALYLVGDLIWRVFDHELRIGRVTVWGGMYGPICQTYNRLMTWSSDVQGDGDGPWSLVCEYRGADAD